MTSNIGSQHLLEGIDANGLIRDNAREAVMSELRTAFRPEFLNRVDDIVLFKTLTVEEIEKIVDLLTEELRRRLADRDISLELTEPARAFIAREGYDPVYGARPLKRFLQHELETRIGRALIAGDIPDGSKITVDLKEGALVVQHDGAARDSV
jgi:ATP-dependent Clp protease ATP-binding subunit ClpB